MSVFKCGVKYKKIENNSKQSTVNLLVANGFIDKFYNILDLNNFRKANSELSKKASEKLKEEVRLFEEDVYAKKAYPNTSTFKKIDRANAYKKLGISNPALTLLNIGNLEWGAEELQVLYKNYNGRLNFDNFAKEAKELVTHLRDTFSAVEIIDKLNCL